MALTALVIVSSGTTQAQGRGAGLEQLAKHADLVVLGKITVTDPFMLEGTDSTRHTMKVEAYYKGTGPSEISVLTPGGYWTSKEGDKEIKHLTQAVGSMGVRDGEEILAFLRLDPNTGKGFIFVGYDYDAKCPVETDAETGERSVELKLTKKRYMRGRALEAFKEMEKQETGADPTVAVEAKLGYGKFISERVGIRELRERLEEIILGEQQKKP